MSPKFEVPFGPLSRPALYGSWDGDPVLWSPGEAWSFADGAWKPANSSIVGMEGRVLSKSAFDRKFGSLPPLPKSAFHP
jgi:hypothetical protein